MGPEMSATDTFLARADEVLPRRLAQWADAIARAASETDVCPWLLAAVMDRESAGGLALTPKGPAGRGDKGLGHGLMQIDMRSHRVFLGEMMPDGSPAWADPAQNTLYGARLLKEYLDYFTAPYLSLSDTVALAAGVAAYNCGTGAVRRHLVALQPGASLASQLFAVDVSTTGKNYSRDVLARRATFLSRL